MTAERPIKSHHLWSQRFHRGFRFTSGNDQLAAWWAAPHARLQLFLSFLRYCEREREKAGASIMSHGIAFPHMLCCYTILLFMLLSPIWSILLHKSVGTSSASSYITYVAHHVYNLACHRIHVQRISSFSFPSNCIHLDTLSMRIWLHPSVCPFVVYVRLVHPLPLHASHIYKSSYQ